MSLAQGHLLSRMDLGFESLLRQSRVFVAKMETDQLVLAKRKKLLKGSSTVYRISRRATLKATEKWPGAKRGYGGRTAVTQVTVMSQNPKSASTGQ